MDDSGSVITSTGMVESRATHRKLLFGVLAGYSSEVEAFKGAIQRFADDGSDSFRQSMDSCRNLIENLIKKKSGESEWSAGLTQLITSSTKRSIIRKTHDFLSAYGVHGSDIPEQKDAEMAIKLTEDIVVWLIKHNP